MEFLSTPEFWTELLWGLFRLLRKVFLVLMPIVIALEFLQSTKVFPWLIERLHRWGRFFGYEKEALSPLLTGIVFGITLGAGVLIAEAKARSLSRRQTLLIGTFLGICHAIFEDTLVFMAIGANGLVMLGMRIPAALFAVFVLSLLLRSDWWPERKAASGVK